MLCRTPISSACILILVVAWLFVQCEPTRADEEPRFFRGLNLNGPPVVIDGNRWEGSEATDYICDDQAFENQQVILKPDTDSERATMIRSSRYGGNRVALNNIPEGVYTVFLYVWEDNNSESFSVSINDKKVLEQHKSGEAGRWDRLGPWTVSVLGESKIVITSAGGTANFSGVEVWHGVYDGLEKPWTDDEIAFFEKRVRPILISKCYECHSAESSELQGDLLVDSRQTIRRGGAKGPAVVPGAPEKSLLIQAVRYVDDSMQMPPDEKLSDAEIADLEQWIRMGAPDPRATATKHAGKQINLADARQFWSLRPKVTPKVPTVRFESWPLSDLDRFVLAKMEQHELTPTRDANKRILIRRATYDLTGLPPSPDEVREFLNDESPQAYAKIVDRLLDSPRYGERWGRHWLDVVRYADTAGDNSDFPIPQIHRYRDWVIDAMNRDLPYDEFVKDQLAGDLRRSNDEKQRVDRLVATGYLANARRFGSRVDDYPQHLTIEDTIDNLGRSFLGLTLSCARCHDHKFDPVTTRDYYALYGIFHSTRYPWPGIELDQRQRDFVPLVALEDQSKAESELAERRRAQAKLDEKVKKLRESFEKAEGEEKAKAESEWKSAEAEADKHRHETPRMETAYAVADAKTKEDVAVQMKGDPTRLGDVAPRRFLTVLGGQSLPEGTSSSGREQLAEWIVAEDNPLTARVMVNRIWHYHFGRGIVPTPNDFGKQGKPPTHPELLDYLANQFHKSGWSIKSMHRLIMMSRTYQQSSLRDAESIEKDPTNDLLAGFPRKRLDAEAIRDTLLVLGGNIDWERPGPHPFPPEHEWDFTQHNPFKAVYDSDHRSVYLMTQRIQRHPFLAIFDGADPSTSVGARMTTTTPLQALFLLNDPFVHTQANLTADRIIRLADDDASRIQSGFQLLFSREPSDEEEQMTLEFLNRALEKLKLSGDASDDIDREAWRAWVRSLFRLNEFVYVD